MSFIDTHAHIYLDQFKDDRIQVIEEAKTSRVEAIFMPNIDCTSIENMLAMEQLFAGYCFAMMGLHPCSVDKNFEKDLREMESWLERRTFSGIGETGTDLYWDKTFIRQQEESLGIQIRWAKNYELPVILHSRDSLELTIEVVERNYDDQLKGIFHCFTGDLRQAERIIDLGFFLGIGGVLTFKNANLDKILEKVPLSSIVLETDSPYLSPVPNRGKRNEPANIPLIAQKLSEIYHVNISEIARITTENAKKIFRNSKS